MKIQKSEKEKAIKWLQHKISVKLEKTQEELETELREFEQILEDNITQLNQVCPYYMHIKNNQS